MGLDRRYNKYWRLTPFRGTNPPDPSSGRIFVEDACNGTLKVINESKQLEGLIHALDPRGVREMELVAELLRLKESLFHVMPSFPLLVHPSSCLDHSCSSLPASQPPLQAERYLPAGWHCLMDLCSSEDRRSKALKTKLMQLQAALPPSALMSDVFDRSVRFLSLSVLFPVHA